MNENNADNNFNNLENSNIEKEALDSNSNYDRGLTKCCTDAYRRC